MPNPWFKFYPANWRSDPALMLCSMQARGVWMGMLCLMHEAKPVGQLLVKGASPEPAQLAILLGTDEATIVSSLAELERHEVFSRTRKGVIYSRKMVKDAKRARNAKENGSKGGNPSLAKDKANPASDNQQDNPKKKEARGKSKEVEEHYSDVVPPDPPARQPQPPQHDPSGHAVAEDLCALYGYRTRRPTYWMAPAAGVEIASILRDAGITAEQLMDVARSGLRQHGDPPDGPKGLRKPAIRYGQALREAETPANVLPLSPATGARHDRSSRQHRASFLASFTGQA